MVAGYASSLGGTGYTKPKGLLRLNPEHPLVSRNLILAFMAVEAFGNQYVDLSPYNHSPTKPSTSTWAPWTYGRGGRALNFIGGAKEVRFTHRSGQPFVANIINSWSAFAVVLPTAGSGNVWSIGQQTDSNDSVGLGISSAANQPVCSGAASSAAATSSLNVSLNAWHTLGVSQTAAAARQFMVDGALQSNTTSLSTSLIGATQPQSIGRAWTNAAVNANNDFFGLIECVFVWNTGIPANLLANLGYNPYQMVESVQPDVAYSFAAAPAAAGGFKSGWAEGATSGVIGVGVF